MPNQKVSFLNRDGQTLSGVLDLPPGETRAYALFAHCFTCTKNLSAVRNISAALTEAGIAVLRFDFTGLGQSGGDFADTNFSSNVSDLEAACDYLAAEREPPAILVGHSLGGTAVLQAAARVSSAVAVATIGSPSDPQHVAHLLKGSEAELEANGEATVELGGRPFRMKRQFLDDLRRYGIAEHIGSMRKALLVLHSPLDELVEIDNASELFVAAKHPKSFVSLDKADHLLTRQEDSRYAGHVLAAWASRYLPQQRSHIEADEGEVVARTPHGGFRTDVRMGPTSMIADEPASVGGSGLGPTPYGLLSAALATCTTMTLQMYARHKNIALDAAVVRVTHDKVHAKDCDDCDSAGGKIDEFQREITLEGDLSVDQRQRMLEIADRCPVHRTLHSEVKIRSTLED